MTKASEAKNVDGVEERLQTSLKRLNTNYIDLYCGIHGLSDPRHMSDDVKAWVTEAKKRGLIKFFGFSTHSNVEKCLLAAAQSDWIDAVMFPYSLPPYRQKGTGRGHRGMSQGRRRPNRDEDTGQSQRGGEYRRKAGRGCSNTSKTRGFEDGQAKVKMVFEDQRITAACIGIGTVSLLKHNVLAVTDEKELIAADKAALRQYAAATCSGFLAGCEEICCNAVPEAPYVRDIMRYLMYHDSYGHKDKAREYFAHSPALYGKGSQPRLQRRRGPMPTADRHQQIGDTGSPQIGLTAAF